MSLRVNAISPLLDGAGVICVHAWIYVDTFDDGTGLNKILTAMINAEDPGLELFLSSNQPLLEMRGRSETNDSLHAKQGVTPVPTGQWVSVGARFDYAADADNAVFLSGAKDASGPMHWSSSAYQANGVPTLDDRIGSHASGIVEQSFDGRIAELVIYRGDIGDAGFELLGASRAVSVTEIAIPAVYFPLVGDELRDLWGGLSATINRSIPKAAHPSGIRSASYVPQTFGNVYGSS